MIDDILVIIPARGGSKGVPGKNIKLLNGKPLITYTIDIARNFFSDEQICVSTDDDDIIKVVEDYELRIPFKRPNDLATDTATSRDVIIHALEYYKNKGKDYKYTLLLQPTSPFRRVQDVEKGLEIARQNPKFELIVSVKESDSNPYFGMYIEDEEGKLQRLMKETFTRRQDCPKVWEVNGAFYLLRNDAFYKKDSLSEMNMFSFEMNKIYSTDIDTPLDWAFAEFLIQERMK